MGMYDELNKISRALEANKKKDELKQSKSTQEQYIKYNILSILQDELMEAEEEGYNLYSDHTRDRIIEAVMENDDVAYLHSKDFTMYFLFQNYYTKVKAVQNIKKMEDKPRLEAEKAYQKELIKAEKLQAKREKEAEREAERARKEAEKRAQEEAQRKQETLQTIIQVLKVLCYILAAPFIILVFFIVEVCKNTK